MGPMLIVVLPLAALALGASLYLWLRPRPQESSPLYRFPCPHCKRRLRYRAHWAGQRASCPSCRKGVVFPALGARAG